MFCKFQSTENTIERHDEGISKVTIVFNGNDF